VRTNLFGAPVSDKGDILGCTACPLNHQPNTNKVKGLVRIRGRKAMMWAMCPGPRENARQRELVGPTSELLWESAKPFGLTRDSFDIQNVVRCMPWDKKADTFRDPTRRELQCCSVYNEEALARNRGEAAVHLILGDVAGVQLLGKNFNKEHPVFWYAPWDSYIVLNHHPSYISRIGGKRAGGEYLTWRDRFRAVAAILKHPGRWGFLKAQNYKAVRTLSEFDEMEKVLRNEAREQRRISFDIEDDTSTGKRKLLLAGFGTGHYKESKSPTSPWIGRCFSVVLDHPQSGYERAHLKAMQERTRKLIEDAGLHKSLQNGTYDGDAVKETIGAKLRGYDYDTRYGTFLRYSFLRSCSLENLTYRFFPEFGDYKDVVKEWDGHFIDAPIDQLVLRNSGDCDITQRLEQRFGHQVRQPLVEVYIHAARTLEKMEKRGPVLDWPNWARANKALPPMIEKLDSTLQRIAEDAEFDCDSPQQVAELVYDKLGLPVTEEGRTTIKTVLEYLQATTEDKAVGKALELINRRRAIGKIKSTYVNAFETSAKLNADELRTIWWLTGTITGRLRSGKGDKGEASGIINFQNLSTNPLLQTLLCSDKNWRTALEEDT
jgi:uracil-DNA glycosylase family 4